jgi:hypothetical protein
VPSTNTTSAATIILPGLSADGACQPVKSFHLHRQWTKVVVNDYGVLNLALLESSAATVGYREAVSLCVRAMHPS